MEFNFSMDATPPSPVDLNAPLFASVAGSAADLGGGECVLRTGDGEAHVMTLQVLQAMDQCRPFRPLDEHLATLQRELPKVPAEGIRRVLDNLIARRLLVSEVDFIRTMQSAALADAAAMEPLTLVLHAGADPARLQHLLADLLAQAPTWRDQVQDWVLIDDAADQATVRTHARYFQDACARLKIAGRHLDRQGFADFIKVLPLAEARHAACLRALTLPAAANAGPAGAVRNRALVATAGRRSLFLDADAEWPLRLGNQPQRGLDLALASPIETRFFADTAAALALPGADDAAIGRSAFALHQQALGQQLGQLLASTEPTAWRAGSLRGVALSHLPGRDGQATIVATYTGYCGEARGNASEWLFLLDARARQALMADRDPYLQRIDRPAFAQCVARAGLIERSNSWPLTLDGRTLLPFAQVAGGASEAWFGSLLKLAQPQSFGLQLPTLIGRRNATAPRLAKPGSAPITPSRNDFFADYLLNRLPDVRAAEPARRLTAGAEMLRDLAAASDQSLLDLVDEYLQIVRSDLIGKLQAAAAEAGPDAPLHWLADLRSVVTVNGRALIERKSSRWLGMAQANPPSAVAAEFKAALLTSADAMTEWPAIWAAASQSSAAVQKR